MRSAALLVLASCNSLLGVHDFDRDAGIAAADAPADTGPPIGDGPLPDTGDPLCVITPTATPTAEGSLGNPLNGTPAATLVCPTGEVPVGLRFDISAAGPPNWFQPAVLSLAMRCGIVARPAAGGAYATTLGMAAKVTSDVGNCTGWPASAVGTELDCPSGSVLVQILGNEDIDTANEAESMFNSLTAVCRSLDATGKVTGTTTATLGFTSTGNAVDLAQAATCTNGEVLVQLAPRVGCGIDAVTVGCAPTACQ